MKLIMQWLSRQPHRFLRNGLARYASRKAGTKPLSFFLSQNGLQSPKAGSCGELFTCVQVCAKIHSLLAVPEPLMAEAAR